MPKLYVYSKPNVMTDHDFSDDVAITKADNIEEAVQNFRKFYDLSDTDIDSFVRLVEFTNDVAILTEY